MYVKLLKSWGGHGSGERLEVNDVTGGDLCAQSIAQKTVAPKPVPVPKSERARPPADPEVATPPIVPAESEPPAEPEGGEGWSGK